VPQLSSGTATDTDTRISVFLHILTMEVVGNGRWYTLLEL